MHMHGSKRLGTVAAVARRTLDVLALSAASSPLYLNLAIQSRAEQKLDHATM